MKLRLGNVGKVRAGVETGLTHNEISNILSCRSGDIQQSLVAVCRVRRASNLFNPERHFFANWLASRLARPLLARSVGSGAPLNGNRDCRPEIVAMCEGNRIPIGG